MVSPGNSLFTSFFTVLILLVLSLGQSWGQQEPLDGRSGRNLALGNFRPKPSLKVRQTLLEEAQFPVVDVHTHFRHRLKHDLGKLDEYVRLMD